MNELFFCPLECGARISYLYKHLMKCKNKAKLGNEYQTCPYNNNHIIKYLEYRIHVENCPDKSTESDEEENNDEEEDKFDYDSEEENKKELKKGKKVFPKKNNTKSERIKTTFDKIEDVDEDSKNFYQKVYID